MNCRGRTSGIQNKIHPCISEQHDVMLNEVKHLPGITMKATTAKIHSGMLPFGQHDNVCPLKQQCLLMEVGIYDNPAT